MIDLSGVKAKENILVLADGENDRLSAEAVNFLH